MQVAVGDAVQRAFQVVVAGGEVLFRPGAQFGMVGPAQHQRHPLAAGQANAGHEAGRVVGHAQVQQLGMAGCGHVAGQHPLAEAAEEEYEHQDAQRDQQRVAEQVQVDPHRFTAR